MLGPMKEKELTPGTVFPVLGTLLFFLPERYREKLCCVTPLTQKVTSLPLLCLCLLCSAEPELSTLVCLFLICVDQPKEISTQPYLMAKKDSNGAAHCKDDSAAEDKETDSDRTQTQDEDLGIKIALSSSAPTTQIVQETSL